LYIVAIRWAAISSIGTPDQFSNRFAIEGAPVSVQVFDWSYFRHKFKISAGTLAGELVDHYFECLNRDLQDSFRREFQVAQQILVAAGAPHFNLDLPGMVMASSFVCIYQKIARERAGYFCPIDQAPSVDYANIDHRIPAKEEELRRKFSFTGLTNSEIYQTLGTYCRFVVKAKTYEDENRLDEAFLHYVIALDLLFGGKDESTQAVSRRTAMIVSRVLEESFQAMVKRMKTIYEKRSKYVHAGVSVSNQDMKLVQPVINEVLFCLLRLQAIPDNKAQGFVNAWLKTDTYPPTHQSKVEANRKLVDFPASLTARAPR
jgi:hypothetical protein